MPALWGGIATGVGALGAGAMGMRGQSSANAANREMSLQQMMFQERMARHAHRYEVADLRKAGLNPILSGTGGAGSATPSGSTARMESVQGAGISSALEALSKITDAVLVSQQAKKTVAETEATKAGTGLTTAKTVTEQEQPGYIGAQRRLAEQQASTAAATQRNIQADTLIKEMGPKVQLSEINKNNQMTDLLREQGLTQQQQTQLLKVNIKQADEILKQRMYEGLVSKEKYEMFKAMVSDPLKWMRGEDTDSDRKYDRDRNQQIYDMYEPNDFPSYRR